ncbi:flavin reductase family protein [Halomonas sp. ZH2S]|uniref:Flavin reductase family protein n=1 Tax=Vreelandella zhuhanensis TaxID=2684210 RepID=A0A7X3H1S3_9GAMM|nr:flavin reductase family protein [Halomonas zhuhanensis]MWJ28946.1 flavin reductase family protein [Halomonas zhuhanensis]
MTKPVGKQDFPVSNARRYLEPGPVVLITSKHSDESNIMTLGWHTILAFSPSMVGCMISEDNYSHQLIKQSRECVINLPTTELTDKVVGVGNTSGAEIDKFSTFGLTPEKARLVSAPLIQECHANFECRLHDDALVDSYNFFIFEIVAAHVALQPAYPETLHYTGDGIFMVSGNHVDKRSLFSERLL